MSTQWPDVPDETPIDLSGLKDRKGVRTRADLSIAEARNVHQALTKYLSRKPTKRSAPFDVPWILKLHREMFGSVWKWAGQPRTENVNIGVPWHQITDQLEQLAQALPEWTGYGWPLLEQAAHLHHRAVKIHPFLGGNGRWSRLLANIWLKQQRHPVILWPEETIGETSTIRDRYIAAIKAADANRIQPLMALQADHLADK
jgi:Fic-DOC domain mobile mystery protein B